MPLDQYDITTTSNCNSSRRRRRSTSLEGHSESESGTMIDVEFKGRSKPEEEEEEEEEMINPEGLIVKSHPNRGKGLFANKDLKAGTLLEESPVLILTKEEWERGQLNDGILGEYGFNWKDGGMAIGLGLASLFNHSSQPNVNFIKDKKKSTIRFLTCRSVSKGEELCICYSADESKLWFNPVSTSSSTSTFNTNGGIHDAEDQDKQNQPALGVLPNVNLELDVQDIVEHDIGARERREKRLKDASASGGDHLTSRDKRRLKALARTKNGHEGQGVDGGDQEASSSTINGNNDIQSPQPSRLATNALQQRDESQSRTSGSATTTTTTPRSTSASPSRIAYDSYPALPEGVITPDDLPAPLHSAAHKAQNRGRRGRIDSQETVELVPDLDWREEDWLDGAEEQEKWGKCIRIKGPAEKDLDGESRELMDIWAVEITDPKLTRLVLDFSKELSADEPKLRHLKRVARKNEGGTELCRIALCTCSDNITERDSERDSIQSSMTAFSSSLACLIPLVRSVPTSPARTPEQLKWKYQHWPVTFSAITIIPSDSTLWSNAKRAWVHSGIQRILKIALKAKERGELPIGVYCTSPPTTFWPSTDMGFIPPTANLRAESFDTRLSEKHPLRHSSLNCVASIANLRNLPLFSSVIPTRNGSDYLLTSMSLFITHEPCVMCSMALLHSRVREIFYIFPRKKGGGFEHVTTSDGQIKGGFGIHARRDLNHRFEVWKWLGTDGLDQDSINKLKVDEDIAI